MKNYIKLFESELEKAEITLAVRDMSDSLQKMASDISRKSVDEVPAITERIKVAHGIQAGNQFSEKITNELNTLVQTILKVKSTIDDTSLVISGDASESEINSMDSFGDMDDEPKDMVDMDDDMDSEMDMDMNDEEPTKEPILGRRVKTENIKHSGVKKLIENASPKNKKIIREMYARGGESRKKVIELSSKVK
jgi:uncharacterized protein YerC